MPKSRMVAKTFPSHHPKKGQPTYFAEKIQASLSGIKKDAKHYTIRSGKSIKDGETINLKQWSGRPYHTSPVLLFESLKVRTIDFSAIFLRQGDFKNDLVRLSIKDVEFSFAGERIHLATDAWNAVFKGVDYLNNQPLFNSSNPNFFQILAAEDGLPNVIDFFNWFCPKKNTPTLFNGQVICWNTDNNLFNNISPVFNKAFFEL